MTEPLKPCPFCGGEAQIVRCNSGKYQCFCRNCGCTQTMFFDSPEEVPEEWNARPFENEKDAEIARLRDALDTIVGLFEINGGFWAVAEKMHETAKQALEKGKEE